MPADAGEDRHERSEGGPPPERAGQTPDRDAIGDDTPEDETLEDETLEDEVEESSEESFPASDPPSSW